MITRACFYKALYTEFGFYRRRLFLLADITFSLINQTGFTLNPFCNTSSKVSIRCNPRRSNSYVQTNKCKTKSLLSVCLFESHCHLMSWRSAWPPAMDLHKLKCTMWCLLYLWCCPKCEIFKPCIFGLRVWWVGCPKNLGPFMKLSRPPKPPDNFSMLGGEGSTS